MVIHIVKEGETALSISKNYGVSYQRLIFDNQIKNPNVLVPGQAIVVLFPKIIHTVKSGETVLSIANMYGTTPINIIRNNPYISTSDFLEEGEIIVIEYDQNKKGNLRVGGYAYPFIQKNTLSETLSYLSDLLVFPYGFDKNGNLIPIYDDYLISRSKEYGVNPLLTLTTLGKDGNFNSEILGYLFNNKTSRENLIYNLLSTVQSKGYYGVNIDFEYIPKENRFDFAEFVKNLTEVLNKNGFFTSVDLVPKTSSDQKGLIYEGIDYKLLGEAANSVFLMTYEWGYTYGPPMAVAPLNKVREVLDYAITQIPANKIDMGIPNYGYDWTLPFVKGESMATIIGNVEAIEIAANNGAKIKFDDISASPYFEYKKDGKDHVVWFEDPRSIKYKIETALEYNFRGISYWNLMRYFRQNWILLNNLINIQ